MAEGWFQISGQEHRVSWKMICSYSAKQSVLFPFLPAKPCKVLAATQAGGRKHRHFVDLHLFGVAGRAQRSALNEWSDPQGGKPTPPVPSITKNHQVAPSGTEWHRGPYTLFAPTNAALAALGQTTLEAGRIPGIG